MSVVDIWLLINTKENRLSWSSSVPERSHVTSISHLKEPNEGFNCFSVAHLSEKWNTIFARERKKDIITFCKAPYAKFIQLTGPISVAE